MGSEDKTYILRKPIFIAENYDDDPDGSIIRISNGEKEMHMFSKELEALFVEFDVDATRKQIETILIGHANDIGESDFADGKQHKKITNKAVDAVFSLITGEKETK